MGHEVGRNTLGLCVHPRSYRAMEILINPGVREMAGLTVSAQAASLSQSRVCAAGDRTCDMVVEATSAGAVS